MVTSLHGQAAAFFCYLFCVPGRLFCGLCRPLCNTGATRECSSLKGIEGTAGRKGAGDVCARFGCLSNPCAYGSANTFPCCPTGLLNISGPHRLNCLTFRTRPGHPHTLIVVVIDPF